MIGMEQKNVTATILEKFPVIEKALALNVFVKIIYTMVLKLLATMSTTI